MFTLSDQLKKLKDDLSASGSHNLVKLIIDEKLPKVYQGNPELIDLLKHISSLLFEGLVNGVLTLEFYLKEKIERQIFISIRIVGMGVNDPKNLIQTHLENFFAQNSIQNLSNLSIKKEDNQLILSFNIQLQMEDSHAEGELFAFRGRKVLIVEDSKINSFVFASFLEHWGVRYTTVYDGLAAVKFAMTREYDGVFMDINMPVMNGIEAIKLIREKDKELPIIVISGVSNSNEIDDAMRAGASDFIKKPASNSDIFTILSKHFQNRDNKMFQSVYK